MIFKIKMLNKILNLYFSKKFFFFLNFYSLLSFSFFNKYILNCNSTTIQNYRLFNFFKVTKFDSYKKNKNNYNIHFFNFFINKFFINKIKKNCYFYYFNLNLNFTDSNKYFNWLLTNFKKSSPNSLNLIIGEVNFFKTILYFLVSKDTSFFSKWLKNTLEALYYKNHKKFLIGLKYTFFFFFKYLQNYLNIKGLKFLLKGKISLGGNSKKKKFLFNFGNYSLTKKNNLLYFDKNYVNTLSGSLGFFVFIFF